jgi:hypothetical protein
MDYASLVGDVNTVGSIKRSVNWSRVDAEGILTEAQAWIYARLRVREMMAREDVAIALNATSADLPERFLDPLAFGIPGYIPRLRHTDAERFQRLLAWDTDGLLPIAPPTRWTVFSEAIQLNSRSDAAYTGKMLFYQQPEALSSTNLTNWLTSRYPGLVRRATLMLAAEERKDRAMMTEEETRCLAMIEEIKVEADLSMRGMSMDFGWQDGDE